jgi:hypothetical protein
MTLIAVKKVDIFQPTSATPSIRPAAHAREKSHFQISMRPTAAV